MANSSPKDALPVSAPITTDSSGKHGMVAAKTVMRIICKTTGKGGTGFLHKSGMVITAAHIVEDCRVPHLLLVLSSGRRINVASVKLDITHDLALLGPEEEIKAPTPTLPISTRSEIPVGTQVSTWGFPAGYNGQNPLLTVGYLAGIDRLQTSAGLSPIRWVVNAAFNSGNSGGPVLDLDDGSVIGVVSSKLAPIPPLVESALDALSTQESGFTYTKTLPTGEKVKVSEGQVVAEVLNYLRSQTQLVLGHAVTSQDLKQFLIREGVEP